MIHEYTIRIIGEYDILVLSPQMIAQLIRKIKTSDSKELVISAEEILPQGYSEYLAHVIGSNLDIHQENEVYKIIAGQIDKLKINEQKCFDKVGFTTEPNDIHFMLDTNDYFYIDKTMLIKDWWDIVWNVKKMFRWAGLLCAGHSPASLFEVWRAFY